MRKGLAAAGVVAVIAAGSAACGTNTPTTPEGKVKSAFDKLSDQKSLTLGLHIDATGQQIYAASGGGDDDFTLADAKLLASLKVSLSASSDKAFTNIKGDDKGTSVGLRIDGGSDGKQNLIEVRSVDQKLYVRANLKALTTSFDTQDSHSSDLADLNQLLAKVDQLPSSLASVKAALKGQWVSIDPKAFGDFASSMLKNLDKAGGTGTGTDSIPDLTDPKAIDPATQRQVITALEKALQRDAKVTDTGNHGGADHLTVTAPARRLTKDVLGSITPLFKDLPGGGGDEVKSLTDPKTYQDIPNRNVSIDLALKGGKLSAISFDVSQLDTGSKGVKVPLVLSFDSDADPVSAPSGAKQLNPQDLVGLAMSGMFNDSGSDTSSGSGTSMPDLGSLLS
jgi:hypothetical protein